MFNKGKVNLNPIEGLLEEFKRALKNNKLDIFDFEDINKRAFSAGRQFKDLGEILKSVTREEDLLGIVTDKVSANIAQQAKETAILTAKKLALKAATFLAAAAISYLATKVIQYAIDKYDAYVNRIEYATEAVNEHKENLQNEKSELESVNTTLEDNKKKIEEIQSKGVPTITDEADIANLEEENNKKQN